MELYGIQITWRDNIFEGENKTVLKRLYPQPPAQIVIDSAVTEWSALIQQGFEKGEILVGVGQVVRVKIIDFIFAKQ